MARPPQANSEATRAKILRAATHLFASQGEGKTSMRQVAREAGEQQARTFGNRALLPSTAPTTHAVFTLTR